MVFSVTKGNAKTAKKGKLFKSVLWFAVGVKRSTNKKKANLKTRRYKVRREIVYHGKLVSSVTTLKKLRNRLDNSNKMDNLRSWPTLSGGATATNFPSPFYQRNFPSPGSGCDWASVVKQRYFESSADHKSPSSFKRTEETSSLQLKASLVVTKTKRVPEKNHALNNNRSPAKPLVNREDKGGDGKSAKVGAAKEVSEYGAVTEKTSANTAAAVAATPNEGRQKTTSKKDKSRIFSDADMTLLKILCSPAQTNEENGGDQVVQSGRGEETTPPQDAGGNGGGGARLGHETDATVSSAISDGSNANHSHRHLRSKQLKSAAADKVVAIPEAATPRRKASLDVEDASGFNVNIISVKQTTGGVAGITATVTENSLDIDAEIGSSASKILHLTAKNILNTKTELSIFSETKDVTQNFRTQLLKVKSRKSHGQCPSDDGWRKEGKNHAALRLCDDRVCKLKGDDGEKAGKHGGGLAVSLGQNDGGENVVIICKISNTTQGSEPRADEIPAIEKTEASPEACTKNNLSGNGDLGANVEFPRLVDIEAASADGSGERCSWDASDEKRRAAEETTPAALRDDFDALKYDVRKRSDGEPGGKCEEDGGVNDQESAGNNNAVHFTGHKNQTKPLRSKMKYDAAATSFIPVTNWKRKPHASPSLSKYRWIAPPRKDSQLSPRTSLSKFQQNKQVAVGNQSADYRKISKKVDAAAFVGRKTSAVESSAKGNVFAGRGRGSLIKSATFTNSNLDAVDRSYVMSDGMKVVFGPNAVNTPCSKGGGKAKRDPAACKEKTGGKLQAEDVADDEFRPMKPPSRLCVDSYRKDPAKNPFQQQSLPEPYQKGSTWKNAGAVNAVLRGGDNERMSARDQQQLPPLPSLYAGHTNCCFGGEPRNGDVIYRLPVEHSLKCKWIQQPPHPAYEDTPVDAESAFGLKVQEEVQSKMRYAAPPPPLFGSEPSFNAFGMLQQGNAAAASPSGGYSFCPGVKLCQGNPSAFGGQQNGGDKLMDVAWRSHGFPPWADYENYSAGRFLNNGGNNKQQQQTTSENCYGKVDNHQQHPAAIQPVFFIPRKETAPRNHCGEIQNFCTANNNANSNVYSYFCRGSHFVGAFGDQEKQ